MGQFIGQVDSIRLGGGSQSVWQRLQGPTLGLRSAQPNLLLLVKQQLCSFGIAFAEALGIFSFPRRSACLMFAVLSLRHLSPYASGQCADARCPKDFPAIDRSPPRRRNRYYGNRWRMR